MKGSLKWIQHYINEYPYLLNIPINKFLGSESESTIEWLSPRADDDYSEYRDQAFLDLLGISIRLSNVKLKDFWPPRGPQWDALGRVEGNAYFLVEAKANVSEIISSSKAKSTTAKALIKKSLNKTRSYLKLNPHFDLTRGFYQYFNRLAHLYLLRTLNHIPAYLVFIYFVNDQTNIPTSREEWNGALRLMSSLLGNNQHKLSRFIIDIYIDVTKVRKSTPQDLMFFDPESLPFQKEHTCVLLSKLKEETELES